MLWVCRGCRRDDKGERDRIEDRLERIMGMFQELGNRILELEKRRLDQDVGERIQMEVEKRVRETFEEVQEREKRKNNIIVVNLPESGEEKVEDRQREDIQRVKERLAKIPEVEVGEVRDPVRLGKRDIGNGSRPRMLRITVQKEETRRKILSLAHTLNEGIKDPKGRVYFNADRTPKEREEFRKLREELERRKKDEPDLVIRGGKIVKRGRGDETRKEREGERSEKGE